MSPFLISGAYKKTVNLKYEPWEEGAVVFAFFVLLSGLIADFFVWHVL